MMHPHRIIICAFSSWGLIALTCIKQETDSQYVGFKLVRIYAELGQDYTNGMDHIMGAHINNKHGGAIRLCISALS